MAISRSQTSPCVPCVIRETKLFKWSTMWNFPGTCHGHGSRKGVKTCFLQSQTVFDRNISPSMEQARNGVGCSSCEHAIYIHLLLFIFCFKHRNLCERFKRSIRQQIRSSPYSFSAHDWVSFGALGQQCLFSNFCVKICPIMLRVTGMICMESCCPVEQRMFPHSNSFPERPLRHFPRPQWCLSWVN